MMSLALRACALALLAALLPAGASSANETSVLACRAAQLALTVGPELSAATGQNPFSLRLTNRGRDSCTLHGYPGISLRDRRGPILLVIRPGGDQQVTSQRPRPVLVRRGRPAFVVLNKHRCDLGDLRAATVMRLALPGANRNGGTVLDLRRLGVRITYCRGGAIVNVVNVSPFVPSVAAGLQRY